MRISNFARTDAVDLTGQQELKGDFADASLSTEAEISKFTCRFVPVQFAVFHCMWSKTRSVQTHASDGPGTPESKWPCGHDLRQDASAHSAVRLAAILSPCLIASHAKQAQDEPKSRERTENVQFVLLKKAAHPIKYAFLLAPCKTSPEKKKKMNPRRLNSQKKKRRLAKNKEIKKAHLIETWLKL